MGFLYAVFASSLAVTMAGLLFNVPTSKEVAEYPVKVSGVVRTYNWNNGNPFKPRSGKNTIYADYCRDDDWENCGQPGADNFCRFKKYKKAFPNGWEYIDAEETQIVEGTCHNCPHCQRREVFGTVHSKCTGFKHVMCIPITKYSIRPPRPDHRDCEPIFGIDDVDILGREKKAPLRKLLESAKIRTLGRVETIIESPNDAAINRQAGQDLDDLWLPLLFGEMRG